MMSTDHSMDVFQQVLPLLSGDATLQDSGVAALIELPFNDDKGLGVTREPSCLRLVGREHLMAEVIEIRCSPVGRRVELRHWVFDEFDDLGVRLN